MYCVSDDPWESYCPLKLYNFYAKIQNSSTIYRKETEPIGMWQVTFDLENKVKVKDQGHPKIWKNTILKQQLQMWSFNFQALKARSRPKIKDTHDSGRLNE